MKNTECVFCKIIERKEPAHIVYEDEGICCFLDIDPINEGHVLIVPKKHCCNVDEVEDETLLNIMKLSKVITKSMKEIYNCDGYTMMQNGGVFADFGHYHMHVFPRYIDDEFGWKCRELENANDLGEVKEKLKSEIELRM
ncbi:MAG: HIT family protein [Paraclostridium sp.]